MVLIICITRIAKAALDKALTENEVYDDIASARLPVVADAAVDLKQPLIIMINPAEDHNQEKCQGHVVNEPF